MDDYNVADRTDVANLCFTRARSGVAYVSLIAKGVRVKVAVVTCKAGGNTFHIANVRSSVGPVVSYSIARTTLPGHCFFATHHKEQAKMTSRALLAFNLFD